MLTTRSGFGGVPGIRDVAGRTRQSQQGGHTASSAPHAPSHHQTPPAWKGLGQAAARRTSRTRQALQACTQLHYAEGDTDMRVEPSRGLSGRRRGCAPGRGRPAAERGRLRVLPQRVRPRRRRRLGCRLPRH
jgi:hypothetical protein